MLMALMCRRLRPRTTGISIATDAGSIPTPMAAKTSADLSPFTGAVTTATKLNIFVFVCFFFLIKINPIFPDKNCAHKRKFR